MKEKIQELELQLEMMVGVRLGFENVVNEKREKTVLVLNKRSKEHMTARERGKGVLHLKQWYSFWNFSSVFSQGSMQTMDNTEY